MKEYQNYLFDLYGTLLDISTDEHKDKLWKQMSEFYNVYGCDWDRQHLAKAFWKTDSEERQILSKKNGTKRPEIKLERVFARLLFECPKSHPTDISISGEKINDLRERYTAEKEAIIEMVAGSDWAVAAANLFRIASRKFFKPYPNTVKTLKKLKKRGKKVYLLSNAAKVFTMPEIEQSGILPFFDGVYISSDWELMKPEKGFMELLIEKEGLNPEETVMVGNEVQSDVAIALRCGVDSICLNTSNLSEKDLAKQIKAVMKQEKADKSLYPRVIVSGDIGELLK